MTEVEFFERQRGEHAAIRAARRRQRFARRRTVLLAWSAGWYLVFLVVFLATIPT